MKTTITKLTAKMIEENTTVTVIYKGLEFTVTNIDTRWSKYALPLSLGFNFECDSLEEIKEQIRDDYKTRKVAIDRANERAAKLSEADQKLVEKVDTKVASMKELDEELEKLADECDYPYARGAMVCVNRYTDTWEETKSHAAKRDRKLKQHYKLYEAIQCIISRSEDYKALVEFLVDYDEYFAYCVLAGEYEDYYRELEVLKGAK